MLTVAIQSFSFKDPGADGGPKHGGGFVFDCRCVPNPGREDAYKALNGRDQAVAAYIEQHAEARKFMQAAFTLVDLAISAYLQRGFTDLLVRFGCTGGQHRSVYFAEKLAQHLSGRSNVQALVQHLQLPKIKSGSA